MSVGIETPTNPYPLNQSLSMDTRTDVDGGVDDHYRISDVFGYAKSKHILPYDRPLPTSLFTMSSRDPHARIRPFRQRIQLSGPSQYAVRATAQVDNGAMRNCVGLHIWESYGHCLGSLSPTNTRVNVANNTEIQCAGSWTGDVNLGGLKFRTHFVIFDCKGAFDVILGKPWLHEARAVHHYTTDTIVISTDADSTVIDNAENPDQTPNPPTTISTAPTVPPSTTTLDDLIEAEIHRIEALHHTDGPFAES